MQSVHTTTDVASLNLDKGEVYNIMSYSLSVNCDNVGGFLQVFRFPPTIKYFSYIMLVSYIDGGNRSIRRAPPTCRKSLTKFIRRKSLTNFIT